MGVCHRADEPCKGPLVLGLSLKGGGAEQLSRCGLHRDTVNVAGAWSPEREPSRRKGSRSVHPPKSQHQELWGHPGWKWQDTWIVSWNGSCPMVIWIFYISTSSVIRECHSEPVRRILFVYFKSFPWKWFEVTPSSLHYEEQWIINLYLHHFQCSQLYKAPSSSGWSILGSSYPQTISHLFATCLFLLPVPFFIFSHVEIESPLPNGLLGYKCAISQLFFPHKFLTSSAFLGRAGINI